MLAPTFTTHIIRSLFRELGSHAVLDHHGVDPEAKMPSINRNKSFAAEYLLYNVSRKRDVYKKDEVPTEVLRKSITKWTDSEHTCAVVNRHNRFYSPLGDDVDLFSRLDELTRSHVSRILCEQWPDYAQAGFTGGATNHLPRAYSHAAAKWIGYARPGRNQSVVPNAIEHLRAILDNNQRFARLLYRKRWQLVDETMYVRDSYTEEAIGHFKKDLKSSIAKLDYVPKDTSSVRLIMATGEGTMLCQSVFGETIRRALAEEGLDLTDQSVNREWAEIGSYTGYVATVDLSSASDTVSSALVKKFLPTRWYEWLDSCRDSHGSIGNSIHKLEKFASMGNGFCFELETLLFYGMARACVQVLQADASCVSVYGDDIIIPSSVYPLLERYFLYHGLFTNPDKTFAGPEGFRESCGGHYYQGQDVTPFYIKKEIVTTSDVYHILNQLQSWSSRTGIPTPVTINMLVDRIRPKDRVLVPSTYGSRAGLWFYVDGIQLPRYRYNRDLQRHEVLQRFSVPKQADASERWCGRTLLTQWFIAAESTEKDETVIYRSFRFRNDPMGGLWRLVIAPPRVIIADRSSEESSYKWCHKWF